MPLSEALGMTAVLTMLLLFGSIPLALYGTTARSAAVRILAWVPTVLVGLVAFALALASIWVRVV